MPLSNMLIAPATFAQYGFNTEPSVGSSGKCWKPPFVLVVILLCTDGHQHAHPLSLLVLHVLILTMKEHGNSACVWKVMTRQNTGKKAPSPHWNHGFQISVLLSSKIHSRLKGCAGCFLFLNIFLSSECVLHCMWSQKSQPALPESIRGMSLEGWHFLNNVFYKDSQLVSLKHTMLLFQIHIN